jgi:signal transduction histidine kinase
MSEQLTIRPYARLLTMLGDQLIKNEQIAVTELMKNSYDADADWVRVSFVNFGNDYKIQDDSRIVIEDNGSGMTHDVITNAWMNPATPNKYTKNVNEQRTPCGRVIQGEKGIGRFAMLKLGKTIEMVTRPEGEDVEYKLVFDFNKYDDDFLTEDERGKEIFLDDLGFELEEETPSVFVSRDISFGNRTFSGSVNAKGTRIVISNLRGAWSEKKFKSLSDSFERFGGMFGSQGQESSEDTKAKDFTIGLFHNGEYLLNERRAESLASLTEQKAVLSVENGIYDNERQELRFTLNGLPRTLDLDNPELKGLRVFRNRFLLEDKKTYREVSNFGPFAFEFYIFDFMAKDESRYFLNNEQKDLVKEHRVYLLRDGIRVQPYGEPTDDWLMIDMDRGTISASSNFSNDQIVGRVNITKANNTHLKDKTNREGLIDDGYFTQDFICVIKTLLAYLRKTAYKHYQESQKKKDSIEKQRKDAVKKAIETLAEQFSGNKTASTLITQLKSSYENEKRYLLERAERTESLAAVGLSVETTSHDIMLMMNRGLDTLSKMMKDSMSDNFDPSTLPGELQKLYGIFSYVGNQLQDMQQLFVSAKQRRKRIRVKDLLDKVIRLYSNIMDRNGIEVKVDIMGSPLVAVCTDADLLQLLINLFDNSVYWLTVTGKPKKNILVTLDGNAQQMLFSDDGCGILEDDAPYIFDAFYSGKGEEGKGLGLYISKKAMERNDYTIRLAEFSDEKKLSGANFVVPFVKQPQDEY